MRKRLFCFFTLSVLAFVCPVSAYAQSSGFSLKDILSSQKVQDAISSVTSSDKVTQADMQGTWRFTGAACRFESDDMLKKAGGEVAASKVKEKLDGWCEKAGLTESGCTFTFNSDSTFTNVTPKATLKGTYSADGAGALTLRYTAGKTGIAAKEFHATVYKSGGRIYVMFNTDKAVNMLSSLSSMVNISSLKTIASLAQDYDGILLGIELSK